MTAPAAEGRSEDLTRAAGAKIEVIRAPE